MRWVSSVVTALLCGCSVPFFSDPAPDFVVSNRCSVAVDVGIAVEASASRVYDYLVVEPGESTVFIGSEGDPGATVFAVRPSGGSEVKLLKPDSLDVVIEGDYCSS